MQRIHTFQSIVCCTIVLTLFRLRVLISHLQLIYRLRQVLEALRPQYTSLDQIYCLVHSCLSASTLLLLLFLRSHSNTPLTSALFFNAHLYSPFHDYQIVFDQLAFLIL